MWRKQEFIPRGLDVMEIIGVGCVFTPAGVICLSTFTALSRMPFHQYFQYLSAAPLATSMDVHTCSIVQKAPGSSLKIASNAMLA
ncbi:hypothetical protein SCHPADRAFT_942973 [Schizopora paradoxa]|uniref:Uncharacterized protein n=1 Tax=Schizopora paradoxa TaxID=27342 RepID=A0A0H2REK3_9AGAM|nr:hypothetical protein SCHPADRAFT_942973 [Schizopora paradoxa]